MRLFLAVLLAICFDILSSSYSVACDANEIVQNSARCTNMVSEMKTVMKDDCCYTCLSALLDTYFDESWDQTILQFVNKVKDKELNNLELTILVDEIYTQYEQKTDKHSDELTLLCFDILTNYLAKHCNSYYDIQIQLPLYIENSKGDFSQ